MSETQIPDEAEAAAEATLSVAFVLREDARTPEATVKVEEIARRLGMEPVQSGRATMSLRISPARFEEMFGGQPTEVPSEPPGEADFGGAAGIRYDGEMEVPPELADYVSSISVEPPARRLDRP